MSSFLLYVFLNFSSRISHAVNILCMYFISFIRLQNYCGGSVVFITIWLLCIIDWTLLLMLVQGRYYGLLTHWNTQSSLTRPGSPSQFNTQSSARRLRHQCRLLVILAFCQQMAWHVLYRLKAEGMLYRLVYHTFRLHRSLGYESTFKECVSQSHPVVILDDLWLWSWLVSYVCSPRKILNGC